MTALKCVLWRRPRKHSVWYYPTMSLAQSNFQKKYKVRSKKQWLKKWLLYRKFCGARLLSRPTVDNREMPCLEPLVGSSGEGVHTSSEMPTLVPFTTEHEDPVFKMQDGQQLVPQIGSEKGKFQPVVILKRLASLSGEDNESRVEFPAVQTPLVTDSCLGEGGVISPRSVDGFLHREDWLQWPEEYEGCSCEDVVDVAPGLCFPEIDIIDGVEFLSFLQEEDMNEYARTHRRSLLARNALFVHGSPSSGAGSEVFGSEDKSRNVIIPTKTKDITQIKGWKRKMFAEDSKDVDFLGSSPPWTHEEGVVTDDAVVEEGLSTCARPAFVSSSLEEFLKTNSKLHINYLTSYIPNVAPIPSNSPILSIGTLTKEDAHTRKRFELSVERKPMLSTQIVTKEENLPTIADKIANELLKETVNQKCKSVFVESATNENESSSTNRRSVPRTLRKAKHVYAEPSESEAGEEEEIFSAYKGVVRVSPYFTNWTLIREPIVDSEEDKEKIVRFLRMLNAFSGPACQRQKTALTFPTISEQLATEAVWALGGRNSVKKKGRKKKQEPKTPEKRNSRRSIRLPARLLDSALIIPGSEGCWLSPNLSHSYPGKKVQIEEQKVTRSKRTDNDAPPISEITPVSPVLQLKHLADEGHYGSVSVQSLLVVQDSPILQEMGKDVRLPLAAIALSYDVSSGVSSAPLYLLYGSVEVLAQHRTNTPKANRLTDSASPFVPILRSMSSHVVLQTQPFVVQAGLSNKELSLLVYSVQAEEVPRRSSDELEQPAVSLGSLQRSNVSVKRFSHADVLHPWQKRHLGKGAAEVANGSLPNDRTMVNGFGGRVEDVSSMLVSKQKITVVPHNHDPEDDKCHAKRKRRRKLKEKALALHELLAQPHPFKCGRESLRQLLDKATEHIADLTVEAKMLEEEKTLLHATHTRLLTSVIRRLEALPVDGQTEALDELLCLMTKDDKESLQSKVQDDPAPPQELKKSEASWNLVEPCSVRRVRLRNGHTVYVYSSHKDEEKETEETVTRIAPVDEPPRMKTSLWVSEVGEPCYVTQLEPSDD